ncbi:MAG: 2OG-Fe(II) oxygenase, partial [Terriglobus roseus]|nr:2OG-Fe(II) oxygenase [Terriglobus roseus]
MRHEIRENLHFTPKETDIYKIHQSGDLANLDGLDDASLDRLPSLLKLRDALYSSAFREYVAHVAGSGPLSGRKTDMAINVYTPGCHLLCHDDVIGSRRVSYILYLTDPDVPWQAEWGGALRLYPAKELDVRDDQGKKVGTQKAPSPEFTVTIPPAFNQLSFFAVQPGESFHDVEEVYHRVPGDGDHDGGRVRMAISGWYHIPQEGEDGYEEGLEERLAEKSSLAQLQGRDSKHDLPQPDWQDYPDDGAADIPPDGGDDAEDLTEADLELLLKFITPNYLTPDTVEELSARFEDESSLQLSNILSKSFIDKLKPEISALESSNTPSNAWVTARPPHKHRFKYAQLGKEALQTGSTALDGLLKELLVSDAFKKWLGLVTGGLEITRRNVLARRFRKGSDYTLATGYEEDEPRLELSLGITPTKGWGEDGEDDGEEQQQQTNGKADATGSSAKLTASKRDPSDNVGGYEVYMAGEDDEDEVEVKPSSSTTGAGQRRKADPAVYRAAGDDEDDGVLFSMPACWNVMSIVLRDKGTLRFVKYISQGAPGDRWDMCGEYEITGIDDDDDGD